MSYAGSFFGSSSNDELGLTRCGILVSVANRLHLFNSEKLQCPSNTRNGMTKKKMLSIDGIDGFGLMKMGKRAFFAQSQ